MTRTSNSEPATDVVVEPGRSSSATVARSLAQRFSIVIALVVVVVVFGALRPGTFLTTSTLQGILGSQAVLVVLTCALLIPLTAGDYDLSVAGVLMTSQMLIGVLNAQQGMNIWLVIVICLVTGAVIGLLNGAFVLLFGVDPFIVTLGTGTILSGAVLWLGDSTTISGISSGLTDWVIVNRFLGVPLAFWYGLVITAGLWYFLEYTAAGRRLLFVGRGRAVSRLSGLRVTRIRWGALVASATLAALAGILYAGTTGAADPVSGEAFLLPTFAAAFLGSTAILPGKFNSWGSFIAVYFLVAGTTGLQMLGAQSYVSDLFYGGALVVAVCASRYSRRKEVREAGSL
ncbi:ABC transporter permease [Pseudonocardia benzenivorans]|jgi:ribose transport system permease protein|uniref:ABC-type transporter, integral membrane subunit n=2 Tax=Pseudonocardia TaxID=1847 RepID=F4CUL9_PSEUX|nr:ABC transporter permease [Pseudonocardia dioxanivorans]AEA26333.1 ABC-type transporter, integral membrane subunit [Pseudonocardia dioxanivorans CB1190]GJF03192.1 sugar ABC transporter permease [Pseudonocardia sp. D17]